MYISRTEQKQIFIKPYDQILELENALRMAHPMDFDKVVISVIGNLGDNYLDNPKGLTLKETQLKLFFRQLLGQNSEFETFYNSELGRLFVAGFLVATFHNPVGKRAIGVLSGGPYGILRGLGVSEEEALSSVKKLQNGTHLLIARGDRFDISKLEKRLAS